MVIKFTINLEKCTMKLIILHLSFLWCAKYMKFTMQLVTNYFEKQKTNRYKFGNQLR
jgi:hypothetical protein